ncbi:GDP-mannose 4,6-dehydratase [Ralstonia solanacearum]|uniref:GDP-mannose 4,6-dehydratase n=1 Tax=Ralstonia solanacearum TaxID=305 RepID=UPI0001D97EC3|nr:GDP-mannose 4,6-dehydratase [Ralstonia solanacearum]CBJ51877.1 putative GDP-mannose 4,6-dehydratase [Ralstonia solanacearum PSI07]
MKRSVLVTGVQGFTGRYLALELHRAGYEVVGLANRAQPVPIPGVASMHLCDVLDEAGLIRVMEAVRPDMVAHLAAIAFVTHGDAETIYRTNLQGTRNVLEAASRCAGQLRSVLLVSSANVYGNATEGVIDETALPDPVNDYAVSKLAMEYVARLYRDRLPITIVRPFNYTGVGQSESFLLSKIVHHVRRRAPLIELGNLDVARDFSDVRTVVQVYRRLLETRAAQGATYNVCSGCAYTLEEVLTMVRGLSRHDFEVRVNPALVREQEVKRLSGSRAKLERVLGPVPHIPLEDTLRWMLDTADV